MTLSVGCMVLLLGALASTPTEAIPRVRRELRSIPAEERERVFAAMNVMKATSTTAGKARYGADYISWDELVAQHLSAAMDKRCDQAHLGPAFATFHRVFTLRFETALLAVDPSIPAMPYWDYGVEASMPEPRTSELWAWLGSSEGDPEKGFAVTDGRFGHWTVRNNDSDLGIKLPSLSPFGLLRAPWNNNPSRHITRERLSCGTQTTLGTKAWTRCLQAPLYLAWYACVDPTIHTWAHSFLGGVWNSPVQLSRVPCFVANAIGVPSLWKHGCLSCPNATCTDPSNVNTTCPCTASTEPRCLLDKAVPAVAPTYGDFADSWSSPNDPIFFFHHANVDRHFMSWQYKHPDPEGGYGFPSVGLPCKGHAKNDVIASGWPFSGSLLGMDAAHNITNGDAIRIDGLGNHSIYVYDSLL